MVAVPDNPNASEHHVLRRVTGHHDLRLDGIGDLVSRAHGATVLDIGCNRGMAGYEFACNGARVVHGCDKYELGITVAREVFADMRQVQSRFEVVDLAVPGSMRKAFGTDWDARYDIVLLLAIYHKLKRIMSKSDLADLITDFGNHAARYVGWRGYAEEVPELDALFNRCGLKRIQYSEISETISPAAIWARR